MHVIYQNIYGGTMYCFLFAWYDTFIWEKNYNYVVVQKLFKWKHETKNVIYYQNIFITHVKSLHSDSQLI